MNIIIVGGGKKIHFLIKSFVSQGYTVTVINDDPEYCRKLSRKHNVVVVCGDGTKSFVLEDAGIAYARMVIALTPKDPDNLVICQLSRKIYAVERTFAIVNDPNNIEIFKRLGVDTVISTANIISSLIEQKAFIEDITNLIPIEEGKVALMEVEVKEGDPIVGVALKDFNFPKDALVGCIIRKDIPIIPRGQSKVLLGDKLVILSLPKVQSEVLQAIKGRLD